MSCRADKIAKLNKKISDLREYDKICKQRKEHLNNTTQIIDEILSEGSGTICTIMYPRN